ncbi:MAG TPA: CDP-alcohol phosphatidyltransferase family protein [Rhizomicrobium sp.]|nr:CDP-alcohol phosphatidyltransferase family protein [Rhizomicrobium sp.]
MAARHAGATSGSHARTAVNALFRHLPNLLTGLRLASAPAVAFFLIGGNDRAALGIFALAGLSDAVDGFLAKRFGFATRFGRYLDPAADKLLMLVSFVTLTLMGVAPLWLTGIVIGRDLAIIVGVVLVVLLELPIHIQPLFVGKVSTACQIGYVAFALVLRSLGIDWPTALWAAAVATAVATLISWLAYGQVLLSTLWKRG